MLMENAGATFSEKRRAPRARCLREGRCVFNKGNSILSVLVRNISSTGARLSGDELICLPDEFELLISDGFGVFASHWVKRVWSHSDMVGVAFIDSAHAGATTSGAAAPRGAAPAHAGSRVGKA